MTRIRASHLWICSLLAPLASTAACARRSPAANTPRSAARVHVASRRAGPPQKVSVDVVVPKAGIRPATPPELPPFPKAEDRYALPDTSLRRHRRATYRARGRRRQVAITQLAGLLWRLANRKLATIRALTQRSSPPWRIARLRQEVSAHLQECVVLLGGVLETKRPPMMAVYLLAHYLRTVKPVKAIPVYRRLIRRTDDAARRQGHRLDLVQLLLAAGRYRDAQREVSEPLADRRALLLAVVAEQRALGVHAAGRVGRLLARLAKRMAGATAPFARTVAANLPALLSASPRVSAAVEIWVRILRRSAPAATRRFVASLLRRLVGQGRLGAARRVVSAARRAGLSRLPGPLVGRLERMAAAWRAGRVPPQSAWQDQLQARARLLRSCFGRGRPAAMAVRLRVSPGGAVEAVTAASSCLRRVIRAWRFPAWGGGSPARLLLSLRAERP